MLQLRNHIQIEHEIHGSILALLILPTPLDTVRFVVYMIDTIYDIDILYKYAIIHYTIHISYPQDKDIELCIYVERAH